LNSIGENAGNLADASGGKCSPMTPRVLPKKGPRFVTAFSTVLTRRRLVVAAGCRKPSTTPYEPPKKLPALRERGMGHGQRRQVG
jgi:hypothetical protein